MVQSVQQDRCVFVYIILIIIIIIIYFRVDAKHVQHDSSIIWGNVLVLENIYSVIDGRCSVGNRTRILECLGYLR